MSNPLLAEPRIPTSRTAYSLLDFDDDEEDAAADDDDENDDDDRGVAVPRNERWFTDSGFGSPEWWSRH